MKNARAIAVIRIVMAQKFTDIYKGDTAETIDLLIQYDALKSMMKKVQI